jgi:energy-coupling factor transport system ATP-binding protein
MGIHFSEVNFAYFRPTKKQNLQFALKNINLNINETNEFIALLGHTGSGKSTLAQLMNALLLPTSGRLEILGKAITGKTKLKPIRKKVGLVFQFPEYQVFEETVLKDILFGPKNFEIENPEEKARETAALMGISELLDRSPFTLSGGQLRKVAISGILASSPDILILDEPTVGLDPITKTELLNLLKHLNEDFGKTIIIITHDMEVVSKYIRRVIVLNQGEIVFDGDKQSLFAKENLLEQYHLYYPEIMNILKGIRNRFGKNVDCSKHSVEEAFQELLRVFGEEYEQ